jgi:Na+/H+ antiporter NhaC
MKKNETIAATSGDLDAGEVDKSEEDSILVENPNGKVHHLVVPVVILIISCVLSMIYSGYFYNWGSDIDISFDKEDVVDYKVLDTHTSVYLKDNDAVNKILVDKEIPEVSEEEANYFYVKESGYVVFVINNTTVVSSFEDEEKESFASGAAYNFYSEFESAGYGTTTQSGSVIEAFSNCDAGTSLAIGSTIALILIAVYYMLDKVLSFKAITDSFTQGFKAMVPAILILTFAWTLAAVMGAKGGGLDAQAFVQENLENIPEAVRMLFPAIFFVLAGAIAFSTGTSWGTFGVLVPISITILSGSAADPLTILTVSAILGGAVYGDHVSPISDTTILASAGAQCNHVNHVNTQLPYATLVAVIAALSYVVAGLCASLGGVVCCLIMWAVALLLFAGAVLVLKKGASSKAE